MNSGRRATFGPPGLALRGVGEGLFRSRGQRCEVWVVFFKVFSQIETYAGAGSFEGWVRRIMVNESLMALRKTQKLVFPGDEANIPEQVDSFSIEAELSAREILELLDQLPNGYRTVFNLFTVDGFSHEEIAESLGISIGASKSNLARARQHLKNIFADDFEFSRKI